LVRSRDETTPSAGAGGTRDDGPRATDYIVGPLATGLDILLEFEGAETELRVSDLARRLQLTRNKAFRLVKTLESRGFLQRVGDHYRIGIRLLALGKLAEQPIEVLQAAARPEMDSLARETGETVYVLVPDGYQAVCVATIESAHYLRISVAVGLRRPLHAGAGQKMLLSGFDDARVGQVLKHAGKAFTPQTITDLSRLQEELEEIRRRGYSLSLGEVDPAAGAVAAPIYDYSGEMIAAVVVGGAMSRAEGRIEHQWAQLVVAAGQRISAQLGYDRKR
jgi:DNA-binding IclR family transcriptional regulator